jgi:hypothetical protein
MHDVNCKNKSDRRYILLTQIWAKSINKQFIKKIQMSKNIKRCLGWVWWLTPVIPAIWEMEIGRITIQGGSQFNKLNVVICACHPSCARDINRQIEVQASKGKN